MTPIGDLIKGGLSGLITGVTDGASKLISNFKADPTKVIEHEEAMEKLKNEAIAKAGELLNQAEVTQSAERQNEDNQISSRWSSDMSSDNKLSKSTRPLIVLSLFAFLYIIIITDSIDGLKFDVKPAYVDLLSTLLVTVIVAYFGSRGVEKWKELHEAKNIK